MAFGAYIEEASDATQEGMIEVAQRWERIKYPRAYVRKVAMREYIASDVSLKRVAEALTPKHGATEEASDETASIIELGIIRTAIAELPISQRETIAWVLSGYLVSEIATQTQQNADTIRSNLRHARKALRKKLWEAPEGADLLRTRMGRT